MDKLTTDGRSRMAIKVAVRLFSHIRGQKDGHSREEDTCEHRESL